MTTANGTSDVCAICEHANRTGSWIDAPGFENMTHCRECHGSWKRATEFQHCTVCHRTFTNWRAADMHRQNGHCVDPATVTTKAGAPKLAPSSRRLDQRTTVKLWAQAGERPDAAHQSEIERPDVPEVPGTVLEPSGRQP